MKTTMTYKLGVDKTWAVVDSLTQGPGMSNMS
jgi:hypothetical protein